MELSKRLSAVAALVTPGSRLADVGTDHGYIPICLVLEKKIPYAIAMDVNRGPLERAAEHIREHELSDQIEVRLSDGLIKLKEGEADTVLIAGMGGALTIRILENGSHVLKQVKELILQPQSEIPKVRIWLQEHGFRIIDEDMVLEDGKYYPMMKAVHGQMELKEEADTRYGPVLLKNRNPRLKDYLQWEQQIKEKILVQLGQAGPGADRRRAEVQEVLRLNRIAQALFEDE